MADGDARHTGKGGADHVEVLTHADDVRVGIVASDDGVGECAVAIVRRQQVGAVWLRLSRQGCRQHGAEDKSFHV